MSKQELEGYSQVNCTAKYLHHFRIVLEIAVIMEVNINHRNISLQVKKTIKIKRIIGSNLMIILIYQIMLNELSLMLNYNLNILNSIIN